jgi:O-antigen ligase
VRAGGIARAVLVIVAPVLLAGFSAEAAGIPVGDILAARTVERISENGAVEDFDLAIIDYFTAHPDHAIFGVGLGNIHLYATPYLQPEFANYAEGHVFSAKQQWLRYVSELGVVGLGLLVIWYAILVLTLAAACRRSGPDEPFAMLIPLGLANAAIFFASGGTVPEFMLCAGAVAAAIAVLRREAVAR